MKWPFWAKAWCKVGVVSVTAVAVVVMVSCPAFVEASPVPAACLMQAASLPKGCLHEIQRLRMRVVLLEGRLSRCASQRRGVRREGITARGAYLRFLEVRSHFDPEELRRSFSRLRRRQINNRKRGKAKKLLDSAHAINDDVGRAAAIRADEEAMLALKEVLVKSVARDEVCLKGFEGNEPCIWNGFKCHDGQLRNGLEAISLKCGSLQNLPDDVFSAKVFRSVKHLAIRSTQMTRLPESIGQLMYLQTLDIGRNKISRFPESFGRLLPELKELNLVNNRLTHLPESIGQLMNLRKLLLGGNRLAHFPESLGQFSTELSHLILRNNRLTHLPESFGRLMNLQTLSLGGNKLTHLPESFGQLRKLELLYLDGNRLTSLPGSIGQLRKLVHLYLVGNELEYLPESFGRLTYLKKLRLSDNKLVTLPESFGNLTSVRYMHKSSIRELDLSNNRLTSLPESFGELGRTVLKLSFRNNRLANLPDSFRRVERLNFVDLSRNHFTSVPRVLHDLSFLKDLILDDNGLTQLPEWIGDLRMLTILSLRGNRLTQLPESIGNISGGLENLDVSKNRLTHIPKSIGLLTSLSNLLLEDNQLAHLPESIGDLIKLQRLNLKTNMFTALPAKMPVVEYLDISENMLTSLDGLNEVTNLVAHHNFLTEITAKVATMQSVENIDLRFNKIVRIPKFHGTRRLREVHLQHNKIADLPQGTFDEAPELASLSLSHNKLRHIADDAFQGTTKLKRLFLSNNLLEALPSSVVTSRGMEALDVSNNHLKEMGQSLWEWLFSVRNMDRNLANNHIVEMWMPDIVPRFRGGALYLDKLTIGAGDTTATVGQMIGATNSTRLTWMKNNILTTLGRHGEECFFEQLMSNGRAKRVYLRQCVCQFGFYEIAEGQGCSSCPRHAVCKDGMVKCTEGYHIWYDGTGAAQCVKCPEDVECHGNRVHPQPGQWWDLTYAIGKSVNESDFNAVTAPQSATAMYQREGGPPPGGTLVYSCHNPDACEGGENAGCAKGYEGQLCAACSDGHFSSGHGVCEQCPDIRITITYSVLGFLTASVLTASVFLRADKKVKGITDQIRKVEMSRMAAAGEVLTIVKILVSFLQIVVALDVVFDVKWPRMLRIFDEIFGWVNLDWIKSSAMECLWEHGSTTREIRDAAGALLSFSYYARLCLSSALPLIISGGLFSIFAVAQGILRWGGIKRSGGLSGLLNGISVRCLQSHLLVWTFVYLPVSSKALGFYLCDSFDGGQTHWLHDDLTIQCYTPLYYQFMPVSIATLLVYTLGLPVFVIVTFLMRKSSRFCGHRQGSDRSGGSVLVKAGLTDAFMVLSRPYRDQFGYWDSVEMVRKVLVGAAATLFGSTPTFQLTTALLISFFAAILHFYCWPFKASQSNRLAGTNLILVYLTMSLGLLRKLDVSEGKRAAFGGMVLGLDLVFCCVLLGIILWDMLHSARGRVDVIARRMVLWIGKISK